MTRYRDEGIPDHGSAEGSQGRHGKTSQEPKVDVSDKINAGLRPC